MGTGETFMPQRRGLLCTYPNTGITFNLKAMRTMNPSARPEKFHAVAGLVDARFLKPGGCGMADLWVFVDGRLKLKRMHIKPEDGAFDVSVNLEPGDTFLTLVVTDSGNFILDCRCAVVPDPAALEVELNRIPGVVENGLFTREAAAMVVGRFDGTSYVEMRKA